MLEQNEQITLRDGITQAKVVASETDERGNLSVSYVASDGVEGRAVYPAGDTIEREGKPAVTVPAPAVAKPAEPENSDDLTVTITATERVEAFKEGFKMALGVEMMLSALGLDKDKLNAAIAQTGQIALEAKAQLDRIEKIQSETLEILKKAQADHERTTATVSAVKE